MIDINFIKDNLFQAAALLTATIGKARGEHARFALSPDSFPVLDGYMEGVMGEMESSLGTSYRITHDVSADSAALHLHDDSGLLDERVIENISTQLFQAAAYMLAATWIGYIDHELGESIASTAQSYLAQAAVLFADRKDMVIDAEYRKAATDQYIPEQPAAQPSEQPRDAQDTQIPEQSAAQPSEQPREAQDTQIPEAAEVAYGMTVPLGDNIYVERGRRHCHRHIILCDSNHCPINTK